MNKAQWRVLYRQFLFRVFDLEVLSADAQGDSSRLLGQFAALLIWFSVGLTVVGLVMSNPPANGTYAAGMGLVFTMVAQHFLIATTMLVVGLFAVLSWDATFPDRRDVMVLAPLPVRARTMFLAKVAAVASSLGLTVVLLHCAMGLLLPVVFAERTAPATLPAMTSSPTAGPVAARDLKAVMDRDLRQELTTGELAPGTGAGMVIGVWKGGERRVFAYGTAKADSMFEIGSISKTFTGLMLARMVARGQVQLNEPVRELLPAGTVAKPTGSEQEITLLDLATHHSGLPEWPDNIMPIADPSNPFADYGPRQIYSYMSSRGVAKPSDAEFLYSSLGFGLLGQAMAARAGKVYGDILRQEITDPLGMTDTVVTMSDEQKSRFLEGSDQEHHPVHPYDFGAMAGAGALRSTASDMLIYLEANLHPEKYPELTRAFDIAHRVRDDGPQGSQIALAWFYMADSGTWQHNGATAGSTSDAFLNPRADSAAVVLLNRGSRRPGMLSPGLIGEHIRQRLAGEPSFSLDTVRVPVTAGFLGVLRSFGAYWLTMLLAGVFVYGAVLFAQALMALLLPRRLFLRLSGYLQLAAIALIVGVYFLQPGFGGLDDLSLGSILGTIRWLPSYWFLGLYQQLNGSMHPVLEPLARQAWIGLAGALALTPVAYSLSYWRMMRQIAEEPDIVPGSGGFSWLPRFGSSAQTAIGQFSVRALMRSRQHRLILGFYLGIGFAATCLLLKGSGSVVNEPWRKQSVLIWAASMIMLALATVGTRVAFAIPLDLRANWIFRITGAPGGLESLTASRRALLLIAAAPVWLATAVVCMAVWPGWQNAGHLVALGTFSLIVADICLLRFRKIPFTCSWLPGKSHFHMAFLAAVGLLMAGSEAATREKHALMKSGTTAIMLALLTIGWIFVRRLTVSMARSEEQRPRFEEEARPEVEGLGLYRDGVLSVALPRETPTM
jgi:CubicO group peptidase (beta-lactamase class C family)